MNLDDDPDLPGPLAAELRAAYRAPDDPPAAVEDAILAAAHQRAAAIRTSRRGGRPWWIGAVATVAAVLLVVVVLRFGDRQPPIETDGRQRTPVLEAGADVDVLDAFLLARLLRDERADLAGAGWDVDANGTVDRGDVEHLLDLAVRLEGV